MDAANEGESLGTRAERKQQQQEQRSSKNIKRLIDRIHTFANNITILAPGFYKATGQRPSDISWPDANLATLSEFDLEHLKHQLKLKVHRMRKILSRQ
jgi:hypothetical protein